MTSFVGFMHNTMYNNQSMQCNNITVARVVNGRKGGIYQYSHFHVMRSTSWTHNMKSLENGGGRVNISFDFKITVASPHRSLHHTIHVHSHIGQPQLEKYTVEENAEPRL